MAFITVTDFDRNSSSSNQFTLDMSNWESVDDFHNQVQSSYNKNYFEFEVAEEDLSDLEKNILEESDFANDIFWF